MYCRPMPRCAHHSVSACDVSSGPLSSRSAIGPAVESDELTEHADHARRRNRRADLDRQAFSIPFVQDVERPKPPPAIERVVHEVDRPDLIESRRRDQRLAKPRRHPPPRPPRQIQPERAVHAMHPLVIPRMAVEPHPVEALPEAPAPVLGDESLEHVDHRRVAHRRIDQRLDTKPPAPVRRRGTRVGPRGDAPSSGSR